MPPPEHSNDHKEGYWLTGMENAQRLDLDTKHSRGGNVQLYRSCAEQKNRSFPIIELRFVGCVPRSLVAVVIELSQHP
jgi:hypothetical protein